MSSPARLQYSPADFLARWMPSSTRAGVILDPDLAGTLRSFAAAGSSSLQPDDSFTSDFAPLPPSVDNSCLGVDGGQTGTVSGLSSAPTGSNGEYVSLGGMEAEPQDLPLIMKLEQLRKWQQHMQEQLKAHQLEELLHFQEEQQRLLGNVNGSQHRKDPAESAETSEPDWGEDPLHGTSCYRNICRGEQQVEEASSADRQRKLSTVQDAAEEEDLWSSRDDPEADPVETDFHTITQQHRVTTTHDRSNELVNEVFHDRPIKPGVGLQRRTFEELLEEQLRLEEQRLKVSKQQQPGREGAVDVVAAPKRTFLKRGEGLARFTTKSKASSHQIEKVPKLQPQARVISHSNSESASIIKVNTRKVPRLPIQRKTAILNKENRLRGVRLPPAESRAARTKVLGGRQEQNTARPESNRTDSEGRTTKPHHLGPSKTTVGLSLQAVRNSAHIMQPNPVTKQVGVLESWGKAAEDDSPKKKSLESKVALTKKQENSHEEVEVPSDSFELSFQEKLRRWACDRQQESVDLGEFELLEQAAEELSFSSNSSFVVKVLQMDRQRWHAARGRHQRRLSSTPIKSPPRGVLERCSSAGDSGGLAGQSTTVNGEALGEQLRADTLKKRNGVDEQNGEKQDKEDDSDVQSCSGSEFGDEEVAVKSTVGFPARSHPPYDKRSYQDEDSFRDSASDGAPDDEESDGVLDNVDDSTLIEDEDIRPGRVVFDDDDTWNDLEDPAAGPATDMKEEGPVSKLTVRTVPPPEMQLVRKVAVVSQEADPPPASQLMKKFFPLLKPKGPPHPHLPAVTPVDKNPTEETGQQVQSRQLRERLAELEIEIERFKKENSALAKLRQENEKIQENLRRERSEFERTKAEDAAKFEEYKKEENKKLQKERKLFETHVLATRALPDKKEREETQALKQQLNSVQEELRRREGRWTSTHSRLRQQIDALSQENNSLRDEIRMLEKLRLSAWKKNPTATEKDSPRVFENNVSAVTKGVTFASPLDTRGSSSSPPQTGMAAGTRRPSRETSQAAAAAAGRKSSLRKPAGPGSCSSSVPSRKSEEKSAPATKSQETQQEQMHNSPKRDAAPNKPGCSDVTEQESVKEMITHPDGKVEKVLVNGDRIIVFPNGTRKEVSADGESVKVTFFNGDTKQITADHRVTYYYADAQTTHITYPDGMEVLHFPNNQTEKHFPDGRKEITFPDQTVKNLFPSGREESVLTDGTVIQVNPDGTKEIHFNTGQKEIHTADYKRREYPDGTVKTVYTDGRQETRYPTGRVRIKDKDGNVVLDNMV